MDSSVWLALFIVCIFGLATAMVLLERHRRNRMTEMKRDDEDDATRDESGIW